jgi:lambda repressor-like predicted transcriptional regulator
MMGRGAPAWAGEQDAVAELLDMTQEEIQAERHAGKSLAQIAEEQGVSEETLINTILNAKKDVLAELVDEGKLTQSQADFMIQNMADRVKTMVERTGVGPAFGQDGAPGMMGRGMRGGRWNRP